MIAKRTNSAFIGAEEQLLGAAGIGLTRRNRTLTEGPVRNERILRWRKADSNSRSLVETNRQIAPWPWRLGMLSLDNFGSHLLYQPLS